jgi:hypothetical protein
MMYEFACYSSSVRREKHQQNLHEPSENNTKVNQY